MERWKIELIQIVERNPIVIMRFDEPEWYAIRESRRGVTEFTSAYSHQALEEVHAKTPCLICTANRPADWPAPPGDSADEELYFGYIGSKRRVTTHQSRVKVKRTIRILPNSESDLSALLTDNRYANDFKKRLIGRQRLVKLSPKLSQHLIERLWSIQGNDVALCYVAKSLTRSRIFCGPESLQEDAVRTALMAFNIQPDSQARELAIVNGADTALSNASIREDSVIEHDAHKIPGFDFVMSDITGRAVFESGNETLEVYTANRGPLEEVFGVDLIYLNLTKKNIVMLQYKMLEPDRAAGRNDWVYRPDNKLYDQIGRMNIFASTNRSSREEYRICADVFYLKFVRRDSTLGKSGIILPIAHFQMIQDDPGQRGPRGGLRISYEALSGQYLRQLPFVDLIRSGYIGGFAEDTKHFQTLIKAILQDGRSVVAAIQRHRKND